MARRLFNISAKCSAAIFCLILLAWVFSYAVDPARHRISFSPNCHFTISEFDGGQRFSFFSYARWGPGLEGTWFVVDSKRSTPQLQEARYLGGAAGYTKGPHLKVSWFDAPGIYYRLIQPTPPDPTLWSLAVSLWYPLLASAVLPAIWILRWIRLNRRARGFAVITPM